MINFKQLKNYLFGNGKKKDVIRLTSWRCNVGSGSDGLKLVVGILKYFPDYKKVPDPKSGTIRVEGTIPTGGLLDFADKMFKLSSTVKYNINFELLDSEGRSCYYLHSSSLFWFEKLKTILQWGFSMVIPESNPYWDTLLRTYPESYKLFRLLQLFLGLYTMSVTHITDNMVNPKLVCTGIINNKYPIGNILSHILMKYHTEYNLFTYISGEHCPNLTIGSSEKGLLILVDHRIRPTGVNDIPELSPEQLSEQVYILTVLYKLLADGLQEAELQGIPVDDIMKSSLKDIQHTSEVLQDMVGLSSIDEKGISVVENEEDCSDPVITLADPGYRVAIGIKKGSDIDYHKEYLRKFIKAMKSRL